MATVSEPTAQHVIPTQSISLASIRDELEERGIVPTRANVLSRASDLGCALQIAAALMWESAERQG